MSRGTALVLGSRLGSGNIGEAIYDELKVDNWKVYGYDCSNGDTYRLPLDAPWAEADTLVVTLGKEGITPYDNCDEEEIVQIIDGSLVLPMLAVWYWVSARNGRGGKCVVMGSYAHDHMPTSCAPYCAAKAGLAQAVRSWAWELTPKGFLFHIVHPYHVPSTPMGKRVVEAMVRERGFTEDEAVRYQMKDMRLREHLTPLEIAAVVGWVLKAPEAQWLSGQGLNMYGGVR
jgi:NAD(P)-dependent dehydrogenase (short-subunit alcohol dehydrogenase family)